MAMPRSTMMVKEVYWSVLQQIVVLYPHTCYVWVHITVSVPSTCTGYFITHLCEQAIWLHGSYEDTKKNSCDVIHTLV